MDLEQMFGETAYLTVIDAMGRIADAASLRNEIAKLLVPPDQKTFSSRQLLDRVQELLEAEAYSRNEELQEE
jgi:hypothetical protein